jgi:predicted HTH transcriptional regulator
MTVSPSRPIEQLRNLAPKESKNDRRENILKLIKEKKEVTIKDISGSISDCSEKTIQRELISLLKDKVIQKTGEKRWSRYFMA